MTFSTRVQSKLPVNAGVIVASLFAVTAVMFQVAAAPPATYVFVGGHSVGVGEQQVYAVIRHTELVMKYRDAAGNIQTKSYRYAAQHSIAFTVEGVSGAGYPVLAVATGAPIAAASAATAAQVSYAASQLPQTTAGTNAPAPPPSPALNEQGALSSAASIADFAPASVILSGISAALPEFGEVWRSSGDVVLPFGTATIDLQNHIATPNGADNPIVERISSKGRLHLHGAFKVRGLGSATLLGDGFATADSFVETQEKLLLGTSITSTSHGNVKAQHIHGVYDLQFDIAIKLLHYIPGLPIAMRGRGFTPASAYLGGPGVTDTGLYASAPPNAIAAPAATDSEYVPSPPSTPTPYISAFPEESLPPIPLPVSSEVPAVSPPPPPAPTPTPTLY